MTIEKLIKKYQGRIKNYDILINTERKTEIALNHNNYAQAVTFRSNEIRGLNDLRQLCIQITNDLEDL